MKRLLCSVCLFLLAAACHSDVFPNDLLYQRWQLVHYKQGSGSWISNSSAVHFDTEYRPDGALVYRLDGQVTGSCCKSTQFTRKGNELAFGDITICASTICASPPSPNAITITQLTDTLLELTRGEVVSQYKSVK